MPTMTPPAAPIPVHMAYAVPIGKVSIASERKKKLAAKAPIKKIRLETVRLLLN